MPRDLKEPEGWRFSSLRKMRQPAALESVLDSTNGVSIHGFVFGEGRAMDPMAAGFVSLAGAHFASSGLDVDIRGFCTV